MSTGSSAASRTRWSQIRPSQWYRIRPSFSKSRLLEVLEAIACRAVRASGVSAAAVFQVIEQRAPTLLIDEFDTVFRRGDTSKEDLRGVINSGNRRGSTILRGGKDGQLQEFATFCPKALAGIDTGAVPDTIRDRSITIRMVKKLTSEKVERLRLRELEQDSAPLRDRLRVWGAQATPLLEAFELDHLEGLSDRADDGWEPLAAIADLAGSNVLARVRLAAVGLSVQDDDTVGLAHRVLAAIRDVFEERQLDVLFTNEIVGALNGMEFSDFTDMHAGLGIQPRDLGKLLKPYSIMPRSVRRGDQTKKGYKREQFEESFRRYLQRPTQSSHPSHPKSDAESPVTDAESVTSQLRLPSLQTRNGHGDRDAVTDVTANLVEQLGEDLR